MALTVKQEKFCQLYAVSGNATQSYIDAGYKAHCNNTARAEGSKLLSKPNIQARLKELQAKSENAAILTLEQIKERLTLIAMQGLEEETIVVEGCGNGFSEGRIKRKKASIRDATKALELLAKMKGAFNESGTTVVVPVIIGGEQDLKD